MTTTTKNRLCIGHIKIQNYKRVEMLEVDLEGKHMLISGSNGAGKTSLITAFAETLYRASKKDSPEPIRHGADRAENEFTLIDRITKQPKYIVTRSWTDKRTTLRIKAPDGSPFQNPDELLRSLVDEYTLKPITFLDQREQDQIDDVLRVHGVEPPVAAVRELTGEDCQPHAGESASAYLARLSADDDGIWYCRRRDARRELDRKKAALSEQQRIVSGFVAQGPAESVADLLKEREKLQRQRDAFQEARSKADTARAERDAAYAKMNALLEQNKRLAADISELERRLKDKRAEHVVLDGRIATMLTVTKRLDGESAAARNIANEYQDPAQHVAALDTRIALAEKSTAARAKRQAAEEQVLRLAEEEHEAEQEHARLDLVVSRLRDLRANLLNGVKLCVDGLTIGDGELRLNGVPFRQASQAEQTDVAWAIAIRRSPDLRVIVDDNCERLDKKTLTRCLKRADEAGIQCVLTFVRDVGPLEVEMVEASK